LALDDAAARRLLAFNRFGMGARYGVALGDDPRGALKAELAKPDIALIDADTAEAAGLAGTTPDIQAAFAAQAQRRQQRDMLASAGRPPRTAAPGIGSDEAAGAGVAPAALVKPAPQPEQVIFRAEAAARFAKVRAADIGFVERLVAFWSNHFCVSVAKGDLDRVTAGSFEREAIRPYVLGPFADMLMAVERHPAMLYYLDNAQSVGPDSVAGLRQKRGLNENLAREIMELHTLGVGGGYAQADVTSLARVLTGWGFAGREGRQGEPGSFVFNARAHEPGDAMVFGKAYLQEGLGQGERALGDLARHPATARHIATKLARHFLADEPPPAPVDKLTRVFLDRDGDLRAMAGTLIDMPESWTTPPAKLRSPNDYVMAAMRLFDDGSTDPGPALARLRTLGMPLWEPPGPNGFPDVEAAWGSPEGMKLRLDLAAQAAHAVKAPGDPNALLEMASAGAASAETRLAVARAESKEQAIALLLMSPEFQRR
jgi:uncharacterized protein (DUF1800 family)